MDADEASDPPRRFRRPRANPGLPLRGSGTTIHAEARGTIRGRLAAQTMRTLALLLLAAGAPLAGCRLTTEPATDTPEQLVLRADARFATREMQAAFESYKVAAMAARQDGDDPVFVSGASGVVLCLALMGEPAAAGTWLEEARGKAALEHADSWTRFQLASGALLVAEGLDARGVERLQEAYAYAMAGQRWSLAMQAAQLAAASSEGEAKLRAGRQLLAAAQASEQPTWIAAAHESLGWIHDAQERRDEAVEAFAQARRLLARQSASERVRVDWAYGRALRLAGRMGEAATVLAEARAEAVRAAGALVTPGSKEWIGRIAWEQGEVDAARGNLESALRNLRYAERNLMDSEAESLAPELLADLRLRAATVRAQLDGLQVR